MRKHVRQGRGTTPATHSTRRFTGTVRAAVAVALVAVTIPVAPRAAAEPADSLRSALNDVRSASCGPLQSDPLLEQAAQTFNEQTDAWLNQEGRVAPANDPMPLLKDRGYGGDKALLVEGAGVTDADAIKMLLLEGYLDLSGCSYTKYGVSLIRNRTTSYFLRAAVLAE